MSRYIDADRFEKWLSVKFSEGLIDLKTAENVASILKYAPTADVKPVVRGEWVTYNKKALIPTGEMSIDEHGNPYKVREHEIIHLFRCSNCKYVEEVKTPFCCECGADMRGENMRVECEICGSYCEVKNKKEANKVYEECNHICPNCLTIGSLYFNEKGERNES